MPLNSGFFRLGPCNIYRFEAAAFVLIGYVDNTVAQFTPGAANLLGGQNGTSPMDKVIVSLEGTLTFDCQQIELKNWQRALAGNQQSFQGVTTPANHRIEFQTNAGKSLRGVSTQMKVVPIVGGVETTNVEEILMIPIAAPRPETIGVAFNNSNQRVIHMAFDMYADDTKRNRVAYMGDDSVDTTAAAAW